jgi:4-amino-4-deoxychorismate lyase
MCLLLETIRFENGAFQNLRYHQERMDASRKALFPDSETIDLEAALRKEMASGKNVIQTGLLKCRVVYGSQIRNVEWIPYNFPKIKSLKIVFPDEIEYAHKYEDRTALNKLFKERGNADDILIVKHGLITDTSFCNILFYNGKNWITPSFPLLRGTQRRNLLEQERIIPVEISPADLRHFSKARLINAMIRFEDALDIDIQNIF